MKQSTPKVNYDHPHKVNGIYTDEFVFKVSETFHFTSLNNEEMSAKFQVPKSTIRQIAVKYTAEEIMAIKQSNKKKNVIMIDEQYIEAVMEILMINKIPFDTLQDATIQLEYQSKM